MKKNIWLWTVLIISLIYSILFWYSQSMFQDEDETYEGPPVLSENRSAGHAESSSGKYADGFRI
jgi:hypothetical protein